MNTSDKSTRRALFAGSFNPFTKGHADIVDRALRLFDAVVIAVGVNPAKPTEDIDRRIDEINRIYVGDSRVEVITYSGLTCEAAHRHDCCALLRGVRNVTDFEYERNMADINFKLSGIETVILMTRPELSYISSSVVRELLSLGVDVSDMLPKES